MKKKIIAASLIGVTLFGTILYLNYEPYTKINLEKKSSSTIAMYIEDDSGNYNLSSSKSFPTDGYELDLEKSSCKNGGSLSQDETTKAINLSTSTKDSCSLYFKKENKAFKTLTSLNLTSKGILSSFDNIAPRFTTYSDDGFSGTVRSIGRSGNLKDTYMAYSNQYTFDEKTGTYTLINPQICQYNSCYSTIIGKYIASYWGEDDTSTITSSNLSSIYKVAEGTTLDTLKYIESSKSSNYDYSGDGIYEMEDDYGTSYYFRGAVENNYVKFGKSASGQDMYWRIIRVNGDGSLRIMYTGTQAYANGTNNSDMFIKTGQPWNSTYNDVKYVGWMYGPAGSTASTSKEQAQTNTTNSEIKTVVDTWYKENIVDTGYSSAVSDELFCNDRSIPGQSVTEWTSDTGLGYGTNKTGYGAFGRFMTGNNSISVSARTGVQPTFKCAQKNDAFTVSDTEVGNGALTYPVGLITSDEIVTAGSGKYGTANDKYYLYRPSNWYWSFSPSYYRTFAHVFYVNASGDLSYNNVNNTGGAIAPVINISAEWAKKLLGTGTTTDPYRLPTVNVTLYASSSSSYENAYYFNIEGTREYTYTMEVTPGLPYGNLPVANYDGRTSNEFCSRDIGCPITSSTIVTINSDHDLYASW